MKYFLRVFFVLLLAVAIVFGVYCYTDAKNSSVDSGNANLTTVTKAPVTEIGSDRVFITRFEQDNEKFELFQRGEETILIHNGVEHTFQNWSPYLQAEELEIRWGEYDADPSEKELAIKVPSIVNEKDGGYYYDIYVIDFTERNGKEKANVYVADKSKWHIILDDIVKTEVSQPSFCPKFIQLAMTYKWEKNINYNEEGIADALYHAYSHALKDGKGGYLKTDRWSYGHCMFDFNEDDEICVSVDLQIHYKGSTKVQTVGVVRYRLMLNNGFAFVPKPKSIGFTANKEYRSLNPKNKAKEDWTYIETNTDMSVSNEGDKTIDWLKYTFEYDPTINQKSVSYAGEQTEMKNVSKLVFDSKKVQLFAKPGYSFSKHPAEVGDFKIVINENDENNKYEIAYTANVTEQNGEQVLTIEFENDYPQSYYQTMTIYYNTES